MVTRSENKINVLCEHKITNKIKMNIISRCIILFQIFIILLTKAAVEGVVLTPFDAVPSLLTPPLPPPPQNRGQTEVDVELTYCHPRFLLLNYIRTTLTMTPRLVWLWHYCTTCRRRGCHTFPPPLIAELHIFPCAAFHIRSICASIPSSTNTYILPRRCVLQ